MIRTVTLNTGFDEFYEVGERTPDDVGTVLMYRRIASGKGINAARAVAALGSPVVAYALIGKSDEQEFTALTAADGIDTRLVTIDQPTRRNLTVLAAHDDTPAIHYRAEGYDPNPEHVAHVARRLERDLADGDIVLLSGSGLQPDGRDWHLVADVLVKRDDVRVIVDVYGTALPELLAQLRPFCAKPNRTESQAVSTDPDIGQRLRALADLGVQLPVITLGPKGLCYLTPEGVQYLGHAAPHARMLVGAGDVLAGAIAHHLATGLTAHALLEQAESYARTWVETLTTVRPDW